MKHENPFKQHKEMAEEKLEHHVLSGLYKEGEAAGENITKR